MKKQTANEFDLQDEIEPAIRGYKFPRSFEQFQDKDHNMLDLMLDSTIDQDFKKMDGNSDNIKENIRSENNCKKSHVEPI